MERDYLSSLLNLFRKRINKIFVGLLIIIIAACDFDNPADFVVPTWFLDIKLPLVSKRFPMGDLVDSLYIFPTDDTLGFQIFFGDSIDPPFQPDQIQTNVLFENGNKTVSIPETNFGGIDGSEIDIPDVIIPPADFDPPAPITIPISFPEELPTYLDENFNSFSFPLDIAVIMDASVYNEVFVNPMNEMLNTVFTLLSTTIEMPFDAVLDNLPDEADFINGVKEILMADNDENYYSTEFTNGGFPTTDIEVSSKLVTGPTDSELNDILAHHTTVEIETNDTFSGIEELGDKTLKKFISLLIECELALAPEGTTVTLNEEVIENSPPPYIDFEIKLSTKDFKNALVSIQDKILPVPDMDEYTNQLQFSGNEGGDDDTQLELDSAILAGSVDPNYLPTHSEGNTISFNNLKSTFPWDIGFNLEIPNFFPPVGGTPVLIETVLSEDDEPGNYPFDLFNHTIKDTAPGNKLGSLDIILQLSVPEQDATIPLDGTDLGGFSLDIIFGSLFFSSFDAYINQILVEDTLEIPQYPPEMSGIGFPELEFEFEFKYSLNLPVDIKIKLLGFKGPTPDKTISPLTIDFKKPADYFPIYNGEEIKMIIRWNRLGSITNIYAPHDSEQWTESDTTYPVSGEVSIDEFFAGMPYDSAMAQVIAGLQGSATITDSTGEISGGFSIKLPLSVTMNTDPFIPPSGVSTLDTMDHDIRNKIRHTLIYSELNTTVENSLPLGGDFTILLSNKPYFPKHITSEALSAYVDTMAIREPDDWDSDDELYIVTDCESLSPTRDHSDGGIYIFNVMSDSSECVEGVNYLVKTNDDAHLDTLVSYVDTLFRVEVPEPDSLYQETNSEGHKGQVAVPGITSYSSVLDTGRIFLLTDYGERYIVPRFSINTTGHEERFFSRYDAIDIKSFITFRVASTGVLGPTENDIVLKFPNGGETINSDNNTIIWETYGDVSSVDIFYVEGTDPSIEFWQEIKSNEPNKSPRDSIPWEPFPNTLASEFVRIIIKDSNSELYDISGYYFEVDPNSLRIATDNGILNNARIKRPGKSR